MLSRQNAEESVFYAYSFNPKLVQQGAVVVERKDKGVRGHLSLGQQGNRSEAQQSHLSRHF